jgi:leucyl aminopeptidase
MNNDVLATLPMQTNAALPLHLVSEADFPAWLAAQSSNTCQWITRHAYAPERGRWLVVPAADKPALVVVGLGAALLDAQGRHWLAAALADRLPPGDYHLATAAPSEIALGLALGWAQGGYRFNRYRSHAPAALAHLQRPEGLDHAYLAAAVQACALARDLVNTPANDLGPVELAAAGVALANEFAGSALCITGAELAIGYPLVAAVGRGSPRAPVLVDLRFARPGAQRVVLVGKGVCFDTGGLDIKSSAGMLLMKKDMGGAAMALATARLLLQLQVPVDLRVLIPAVENSVDGAAFRPGDVWRSRQGLSVEIGNTDAEGRLVLADALCCAAESQPDLLIDFATLTGAARIALGAELPAAYSGDAELVQALARCGERVADPVWPMPLWDSYDDELSSRIADLNNAPGSGFAGSITAALFLRRFVPDPKRWLHLDLYAWNNRDRPGRPVGAEAQCIRAVFELIRQRVA